MLQQCEVANNFTLVNNIYVPVQYTYRMPLENAALWVV